MKDVVAICPYIGKACIEDGTYNKETEQVEACPKWVVLEGKDPQTGKPVKNGNCSDAWMPILMIENTKQTLSKDASVESERNEIVGAIGTLAGAINGAVNQKRIQNG